MTRICHLCNEDIKTGELIGHMRYKLVLVHQKCLEYNRKLTLVNKREGL